MLERFKVDYFKKHVNLKFKLRKQRVLPCFCPLERASTRLQQGKKKRTHDISYCTLGQQETSCGLFESRHGQILFATFPHVT